MTSRFKPLSFIIVFSVLVSASAADRKPKEPSTKSPEVVKADVATPAPKSVFSADKDSRDPFFPKSNRPHKTETSPTPATTATDVVSMLRSGFQGIMGAGENRLAVVNNAIIEPGKIVSVPLGAPGSGKFVRVRVTEILKDSVTLEIEGQRQPLTLTAQESK